MERDRSSDGRRSLIYDRALISQELVFSICHSTPPAGQGPAPPLLCVAVSLRVVSMCSRGIRRSRWSRVGALYLAVFFRFSPIHALPEVSRWPPVAGDVSELEELKLTVSRLELILEKNIEDLNSRFLFHQEKDKTIKEMSSKIQDLQDSICHIKVYVHLGSESSEFSFN
ncbi:unnamed protein product [Spirodela intermedia]|uniref:Uncharacterized protein n=1 Tax=Spirodela intermedia TaxID=51605 RepID=A0A7I8J6P5_SPIIN|nr:unnamed protein product [Spirodela intermedia]CAA6665781.1 unnamed protein product [Spirodela intermedia]